MKLVTKTILYYLLISLPLLLLAGVFGYYLIKADLNNSMEESLWKEKLNAEKVIQTLKNPQVVYLTTDSLSKIITVQNNKTGYSYKDSIIYDTFEDENLNYRILNHYYSYNGQNYLIIAAKSTLEDDDLMESLLKAFALVIGFLILAFFIVNLLLSKIIWKPFYKTLQLLNAYEIKHHKHVNFESSSTQEFNQLNTTLNKMTDKIYEDYIQQKEFTENASHEMQTPLAVVKANLSLLMQSPNLKEEEMNQLQSIENTVKKLSALNKALILLSKIENNQFNENTSVNFKDKIINLINNYQDLLQAKNIKIKTQLDDNLILQINPTLADILITNLLQNAIRHNEDGGIITIYLNKNILAFSNSGEPLSISENDLFVRFKKNDASKDSLGLGLSIIKSITSLYNIDVKYTYVSKMHTFTLMFNEMLK